MTNISFLPSPGFILLKITEKQSDVILVATDNDKTPASQGEVVAIGGPKLHESGGYFESHVKVGDIVVFKPYGVDSIYLNNIEHRIIPFENVRGVLNDSN